MDDFASKIKSLEQELTDLKTGKKISSSVNFSLYHAKTLPETHNRFRITYADGDQPIITDIVGGRFGFYVDKPRGNTQEFKIIQDISEAGIPNILSTREIVKVEAL